MVSQQRSSERKENKEGRSFEKQGETNKAKLSPSTINKQTKPLGATHNAKDLAKDTPTIGMRSLASRPQHKTISKITKDKVNNILPMFPLIISFYFQGNHHL